MASLISGLQPDLIKQVAPYLTIREVAQLRKTCKELHKSLPLAILPSRLIDKVVQSSQISVIRGGSSVIRVPLVLQQLEAVHSCKVTIRMDRSQVLRDSVVVVSLKKGWIDLDFTKDYAGATVVAEFPTGPGTNLSSVSFVPKEDHDYFLIDFEVQGKEVRVQTVFYDAFCGYMTKNFQALVHESFFDLDARPICACDFQLKSMLWNSKMLQTQLKEKDGVVDLSLKSLFENVGIDLNETSLEALNKIVEAELDERALHMKWKEHPASRKRVPGIRLLSIGIVTFYVEHPVDDENGDDDRAPPLVPRHRLFDDLSDVDDDNNDDDVPELVEHDDDMDEPPSVVRHLEDADDDVPPLELVRQPRRVRPFRLSIPDSLPDLDPPSLEHVDDSSSEPPPLVMRGWHDVETPGTFDQSDSSDDDSSGIDLRPDVVVDFDVDALSELPTMIDVPLGGRSERRRHSL